jgi:hypothetical protein
MSDDVEWKCADCGSIQRGHRFQCHACGRYYGEVVTDEPFLKWCRDHLPPENLARFLTSMGQVKDVLEGKIEPPGGRGCRFPYCRCNSPWEKCERLFS